MKTSNLIIAIVIIAFFGMTSLTSAQIAGGKAFQNLTTKVVIGKDTNVSWVQKKKDKDGICRREVGKILLSNIEKNGTVAFKPLTQLASNDWTILGNKVTENGLIQFRVEDLTDEFTVKLPSRTAYMKIKKDGEFLVYEMYGI
jgi:hypothetical protein